MTFSKNLRRKHHIHIDFKVPNQYFQLRYDQKNKPEFSMENTNKGIIIYMFNVAIVEQENSDDGGIDL